MPTITALPTDLVRAWQSGAPDAYGNPPERHVSRGTGNPCRHCLDFIPEGAEMLILAHRPFPGLHPYAETGPIFLCAAPCARFEGPGTPPRCAPAPISCSRAMTPLTGSSTAPARWWPPRR